MSVIVIPSTGRLVAHQGVSAVTRWGGTDWIVPGDTDLNAADMGLSGAPLNAAAISTSGLDVTLDTFEAFVGGAWMASDDNTAAEHTHTLAGSTTTTTLYLGYDFSATDTFIFGPAGDFAADDPKVAVADVTDDGTSVTNVADRRPVGRTPQRGVLLAAEYDADTNTTLALDTGTLSATYPEYDVVVYREDHGSGAENFQELRLNGSSSALYYQDIYDASNNSFTSVDAASSFRYLAGTEGSDEAMAYQVIRISCPREVVPNGQHYPVMSIPQTGVSKNTEYPLQGHFENDTAAVDQLHLFGGENATGWVEIYGRGAGHGAEPWV